MCILKPVTPTRHAARRGRLAWALAALVAVAAGAAWWRLAPSGTGALAPAALRGADVLLITIDTLRTDRLGAYGGPPTAALDALAARGVRFARAYTHAPMTLPSHASILTGLLPPAHGVRNNGTFRLDPSIPTLASLARAGGHRTGAFVGAFVLDRRFGLDQGFDVYDDLYRESRNRTDFQFDERRAPEVLQPAADWILTGRAAADARVGERPADQTRPWFAWVHLFDPHAPYDAPEARAADPYDNEIAFTDTALGSFLDRLRDAGALDRALIVLTADHGEGLGDHGEATHGLFAYDTTLRVPLLIAGPGIAPRVAPDLAAHVDLLPTILDLLGLETPDGLPGISLRGALDARDPGTRALYFEALDANLTRRWAPLTGTVDGAWKYIDLPIEELYDLEADPDETTNLATTRRRERDRLRLMLEDLRRSSTPAEPAATRPLDADTEARLRALGYTAVAPGAASARGFTEDDDPKRLVDLDRRYNDALSQAAAGALDEAAAALRTIIAARPDFVGAHTTAASILIQAGRPAEAVDLLGAARAQGLDSPQIADRLGAAALAAGRPADAAAVLEPLAAAPAPMIDSLNTLGVAYAELGRAAEARRLFDRVLAVDPKSPGTWNNVGLLDLRAGRLDAAAAAFRRAVAADPAYTAAWQGLGAALVERDRAAAIDAWTRVVELAPDEFDTLFNVGVLLAESPEPAAALPYLRRFVASAPAARYAGDLTRVRRMIAALERR